MLGVLATVLLGCTSGPRERLAAAGVPVTAAALVEQVKAGNGETVALLLAADVDPDAVDDGGVAALAWAVAHGHVEIARALTDAGADPGAIAGNDGMTVLMLAAQQGATETIGVLVEAGAVVDARDGFGNTALLQAVGAGHGDAADLLLAHGADPDQGTVDAGATPLGVAAVRGHVAIVRSLLAHDADTERRESAFGMTPLGLAAYEGHGAIVRLLLDAGADPAARDKDGLSPVAVAELHGHRDVQMLLARAHAVRADGGGMFRPDVLVAVPPEWVLADPFTDQTPFFLGVSRLSRARDPGGTSRALVRGPNTVGAQIFLVRGPAEAWDAALEQEIAELGAHPLVREHEQPHVRTSDGRAVTVRIFQMEPGVLAGDDTMYVLARAQVGDQLLVADAGGPTGTFPLDAILAFLSTLDLRRDLGMADIDVVARADSRP